MAQRDFVTLGPVPSDEDCAQVGDEEYERQARRECKRFIDLLRARLGRSRWVRISRPKAFRMSSGRTMRWCVTSIVTCGRLSTTRTGWSGKRRLRGHIWKAGKMPRAEGRNVRNAAGELEGGDTLAFCSQIIAEGYLCAACRMIFADDLTFLATYVG